jgi:hypothetical protein
MGQVKGNPIPSYQNQAYEALRPTGRLPRTAGTTPVMISDMTTLNAVIDTTFDTDAAAALVSGSIDTRIVAVSSSIDTRLNAVSQSLSSSINIPGTYANDTAAATAGVKIGGLYHTSGTVKVRLT